MTVGVSPGDSFTYNLTYGWSSSNKGDVVPQFMVERNQTKDFQITVMTANGQFVTFQTTWSFLNGTQSNQTVIEYVGNATSDGFIYIYAANLGAGFPLFPNETDLPWTINSTVMRDYQSGPRATNHISVSRSDVPNEFYTYIDLYFDKVTGVLVQGTLIDIYTDTPDQTFTTHITLSQASVWSIASASPTQSANPQTSQTGNNSTASPDTFDPIIPALAVLVVVVAVSSTIVIVRSRKSPKSSPPQTAAPAQSPTLKHCINCGYDNPSANEFCGKCGATL